MSSNISYTQEEPWTMVDQGETTTSADQPTISLYQPPTKLKQLGLFGLKPRPSRIKVKSFTKKTGSKVKSHYRRATSARNKTPTISKPPAFSAPDDSPESVQGSLRQSKIGLFKMGEMV